jgi:photosystem II stability/assembly factor-like uncharacterized protein
MRHWVSTTAAVAIFLALGCRQVVEAEELRADQIRHNLFAACMPTKRVGWVVGELGRILRTEDGGKTWTRQDAGVKKPLLAISCLDTESAWVGGKSGIMFRTNDGGATWQRLAPDTSKHVFDIAFVSRTHGVAVGDWGLMMYSDDGGVTWTLVGIPDDLVMSPLAEDIGLEPDDVILYALAFPDTIHGWTVGEFGTIMATADGGRTWRQQSSPVDTTLFGTYFEDSKKGWAVGIDAVILHTIDGGVTWRQTTAPLGQRSFYDIAMSGGYGWIAGDAGTLLKTLDGGATWVLEPLPLELAVNWFRTVKLLPSGDGLAAGGDGLLFRIEKETARDLRRGPASIAKHRGPS